MKLKSSYFLLITLSALFGISAQAKQRTAQTTIYFTPVVVSDLSTCPVGDPDFGPMQKTMKDKDGKDLITVCAKVADECAFRGSCLVEQPGQPLRGFNFGNYDEELFVTVFGEINLKKCDYGYGYGFNKNRKGRQACLDPYFSVAANKYEHRIGEVLFFPMLEGVQLPNGEVHDGYVIIRDSARLFDGATKDEFAIFVGAHSKEEHIPQPFLGRLDGEAKVPYIKITGPKAEEVRKARNYPNLPAQVKAVLRK